LYIKGAFYNCKAAFNKPFNCDYIFVLDADFETCFKNLHSTNISKDTLNEKSQMGLNWFMHPIMNELRGLQGTVNHSSDFSFNQQNTTGSNIESSVPQLDVSNDNTSLRVEGSNLSNKTQITTAQIPRGTSLLSTSIQTANTAATPPRKNGKTNGILRFLGLLYNRLIYNSLARVLLRIQAMLKLLIENET
jgi:hypothetical protein